MKVLVVEDEKNLGLTLTEFLERKGHHCSWASTGAEAQSRFEIEQPDVVLMDIGLPDTSGLELGRQFKRQNSDLVLLFLSALNDPDTKVEGLELGAYDYITKPFNLKELILRLERILEQRKTTSDITV